MQKYVYLEEFVNTQQIAASKKLVLTKCVNHLVVETQIANLVKFALCQRYVSLLNLALIAQLESSVGMIYASLQNALLMTTAREKNNFVFWEFVIVHIQSVLLFVSLV